MIEPDEARSLAQKAAPDNLVIDPERFTETREGWYFPYSPGGGLIGSSGVIIHKQTGRAFVPGSACSIDRDIQAFDEGFQFKVYDLVILEIMDRQGTIDTLANIGPTVAEPEYKHGTIWRIPRRLSKLEIEARLSKLPAVFPEIHLYFRIEDLQEARNRGYFRFEALEFRRPGSY